MIYSNIPRVMRQVDNSMKKIDIGARRARDEMAMTLTQLAKEEIKGKREPGEKATIGQPPKNRTGTLRRSIKAERIREGFASYVALVGPTVVYGRSLEVGGKYAPPTWTEDNKYPYMEPAFRKFKKVAHYILRKHLLLGR